MNILYIVLSTEYSQVTTDDAMMPPMAMQLFEKLQTEGFFVPSVSANYRFFISCAVPARVYLSTDDGNPKHAVCICTLTFEQSRF